MDYNTIIKQIANENGMTPEEIEKEIEIAILAAGLSCTARDLIEAIAYSVAKRTIYSNAV